MIYDCFTFYNELDILQIRLNTLNEIVGKFVLVEMNQTHSGNTKDFIFEQNKKRFSKFLDKIIHIKIDVEKEFSFSHIEDVNRARENFQRNEISRALINAKDDDIIMISDLDEIPNPQKVLEVKDLPNIKALDMNVFNYKLNNLSFGQDWTHGTKIISYKDYKNILDDVKVDNYAVIKEINQGTTATKIRLYYGEKQSHIRNAGWHFSYIGDEKNVLTKCKSTCDGARWNFSEELLIANYNSKKFNEWDLIPVKIDESFPKYLRDNQNKYTHLIIQDPKVKGVKAVTKSLRIIYPSKLKKKCLQFLCVFIPSKQLRKKIRSM